MSTELLDAPPKVQNLAEFLHELGDIPLNRIRMRPAPGTATIEDLLKPENEGCELVDGTLVEKAVGQEESFLGMWLGTLLNAFIVPQNMGYLCGEQGMIELSDGPVRGPDVSFFSWGRLPDRKRPSKPIPQVTPDLAVEVLSKSNTRREMDRKRREYFQSGVIEVWEIDPRTRVLRVYRDKTSFTEHSAEDTITTPVLPGFTLSLAELFAELDRHG